MNSLGPHIYVITIDPNNLLPETNKSNNAQTTPISVAPSAPA